MRLLLSAVVLLLPIVGYSQVGESGKSPKAQPGPELPVPVPAKITDEKKADLFKLRKEREDLTRERENAVKEASAGGDPLALERAKLRLQLAELLKKINERKVAAPAPETPVRPKFPSDEGTKPIDPLSQAQSLYRSGDFEAALRAFRLVDSAALANEDRSFVQYMIASCLRQLGQLSEASNVYRDVAEAREDAFISECAIWQLSNIRWRKDLETQLEEMRQRRKAR